MEGTERAAAEDGGDDLRKRRITLTDGRYLIFFTFGDEEAPGERAARRESEPGPAAGEARRV